MNALLAGRDPAPSTALVGTPPPGDASTRRSGPRRRADERDGAADQAEPEVARRDAGAARAGWHARVRRIAVGTGAACAFGAILSAGWWGPRALSHLAFFRVRRVEIDGARYASAAELATRLAIDTSTSVWTDLDLLGRRVRTHPLVDSVRVQRQLPGVLRIIVHERVPVALVANGPRGALVVYDATGTALPLAPARVGGIDAPLAASADVALLRALGALRREAPRVYARVLEVARVPRATLGTGASSASGGRSSARAAAPATPERDELDFVLAPAAGPVARATSASRTGGAGAVASNGAVSSAAGVSPPPLLVRAAVDVAPGRFGDLGPVEDDLARRGVRAVELDLRFRDQVVARLP